MLPKQARQVILFVVRPLLPGLLNRGKACTVRLPRSRFALRFEGLFLTLPTDSVE
jgi:hypothetical protein